MKHTIMLLLMVLFGLSCSEKEYKLPNDFTINKIIYMKDHRTNLCFAVISSRTYGADYHVVSFTNVECTEKVLLLIGEEK